MFDTERFIAEIERRPAIYDVNSDEYNDRNLKLIAWDQVCEVMIPKWRSLSDAQKNTEEKILRGKWRNIRDYFMKELKLQKLRKGSPAGRKRKKYMYFDQLLFLMPNAEKKQKKHRDNYTSRCKNEENEQQMENNIPKIEEYEMPLTHDNISEDYANDASSDVEYKYISTAHFPKSICETSMASTAEEFPDVLSTNSSSQRIKPDDDDYDKMFLLSLLPIMRRIPEDKKLDVRIQMQQTLAVAMRSTSDST